VVDGAGTANRRFAWPPSTGSRWRGVDAGIGGIRGGADRVAGKADRIRGGGEMKLGRRCAEERLNLIPIVVSRPR